MMRQTILILSSSLLLCLIACSRQPVYPHPAASDGNIIVNISSLQPGVPQFFTYRYQGKNINFFVIKIDEKVASFLDACTSCYPHKRGYRYENSAVTCRFCNMSFSLYTLEKGLGGCYPVKIEGRTENARYLIPRSALQNQADKF
jgi:uncharacterized membrane protein